MARRGRGKAALATAAIGSFLAGTLAIIGLTFLSPVLVKLANVFGATEYFLLMATALLLASTMSAGSRGQGAHLDLHRIWPSASLDSTSRPDCRGRLSA
jgi:putative tricarboxylic transport membrane protein